MIRSWNTVSKKATLINRFKEEKFQMLIKEIELESDPKDKK